MIQPAQRRARRLLTLLLGLVILMSGRVAAAAPSQEDLAEARKHFQRGEKLYALGRFEDALEEYTAAFEAAPLPEFLFNIGQCHRNLGNYDQAIFSFRKFLRLKPDAKNRPSVERLIDELEKERAAERETERQRKLDEERAARERERSRVEVVPKDPDREPPPAPDRPFYRSWWFIGGVAAAAALTITTVVVVSDDGVPGSDLGNLDFP